MRILMIGTENCIKCRRIAPKLEEYCKEHNLEYKYIYLHNAPSDVVDMLVSRNVKTAPAFIIYRKEDTVVLTGDDIFLELESL